MMGKLMTLELDTELDIEELSKGFEHFLEKEKAQIRLDRERVREEKKQAMDKGDYKATMWCYNQREFQPITHSLLDDNEYYDVEADKRQAPYEV